MAIWSPNSGISSRKWLKKVTVSPKGAWIEIWRKKWKSDTLTLDHGQSCISVFDNNKSLLIMIIQGINFRLTVVYYEL